mmetsp:Transcript_106388/g.277810  ORF Transcript_106388/g.277810 Transcript_106388/m.277810 type:complete len:334 (-) Transcript_106388:21-1022(-)
MQVALHRLHGRGLVEPEEPLRVLEDTLVEHPQDHAEAVVAGLRVLALPIVTAALALARVGLRRVAILLVVHAGPVADARAVLMEAPLDFRLCRLGREARIEVAVGQQLPHGVGHEIVAHLPTRGSVAGSAIVRFQLLHDLAAHLAPLVLVLTVARTAEAPEDVEASLALRLSRAALGAGRVQSFLNVLESHRPAERGRIRDDAGPLRVLLVAPRTILGLGGNDLGIGVLGRSQPGWHPRAAHDHNGTQHRCRAQRPRPARRHTPKPAADLRAGALLGALLEALLEALASGILRERLGACEGHVLRMRRRSRGHLASHAGRVALSGASWRCLSA